MKASDWIAHFLAERGVDAVFELIGGMTTHLVDSLYRCGRSRIVTVHHEQAAALAACGWAQVKGLPGVALATSGPGAVNLLTGVATAFFDSIPAVFITGQVNSDESSRGRPLRQLGFQETDIVAMAAPVTKGARQALSAEEIPDLFRWAFDLASKGRPGPVLLDLPMNLQRQEIDARWAPLGGGEEEKRQESSVDGEALSLFMTSLGGALDASERPLLLVGNGVARSGTARILSELVRRLRLPAVWSLMGKGLLEGCGDLASGMIGTYGNRWANRALSEADLLVVFGSRLDIRQTGVDVAAFERGKKIFQVDIDGNEMGGRVRPTECLVADLRDVVPALLDGLGPVRGWPRWLERIGRMRELWPDTEELELAEGIHPNRLMARLASSGPAAGFVTDVGAHQMWAAQSLAVEGRPFLSSGGMGAMGYALPAAMGASLAAQAPMMVLAGDGGFQCNIQELQTVVRNGLPLKIVIFDNRSLGMVRQFQEAYFEGRYPGTVWGYDAPDFETIGRAYGIPSRTVRDEAHLDEALKWLWADGDGPALLVAVIPPQASTFPKMAFGQGLDRMDPRKDDPREGL